MTARVFAYIYDPATVGGVFDVSRLDAANFDGVDIYNTGKFDYSRFDDPASRLSGTGTERQWIEIDPTLLSGITTAMGFKTGVPFNAEVGTATISWVRGGGNPILHPGVSYGVPIAVVEFWADSTSTVLWVGRLDTVDIIATQTETRYTWHCIDAVADLAAITWPQGALNNMIGGEGISAWMYWTTIGTFPNPVLTSSLDPAINTTIPLQFDGTGNVPAIDAVCAAVGGAWFITPPALTWGPGPEHITLGTLCVSAINQTAAPAFTLADDALPTVTGARYALATAFNRILATQDNSNSVVVVEDATSVASMGPRTINYRHAAMNAGDQAPAALDYLKLSQQGGDVGQVTIRDYSELVAQTAVSALNPWTAVDVRLQNRTTRARIARANHTITPDRTKPDGQRHSIVLDLVERYT